MIVAVDIGNTRTKWGVLDDAGALLAGGAVDTARLEQLEEVVGGWSGCRRAVISNVAGATAGARLETLCNRLGLPILIVAASASACGVANGYTRPDQLGSDRWAALVAAWNRYREPCVVATAGTALTVDALSSGGDFLGGVIVPGAHLMQSALLAGTAGLTAQAGEMRNFPTNTGDAMHAGIWLALAGTVERMCRSLQEREGKVPRCILAGGDAGPLRAALPVPAEIADNLVLNGLWLIEKERA